MPDLVREHSLEMGILKMSGDALRPDQPRARDAKNSGFERSAREQERDGLAESFESFETAQGIYFAAFMQRARGFHCRRDASPAGDPEKQNGEESAKPNCGEQRNPRHG